MVTAKDYRNTSQALITQIMLLPDGEVGITLANPHSNSHNIYRLPAAEILRAAEAITAAKEKA